MYRRQLRTTMVLLSALIATGCSSPPSSPEASQSRTTDSGTSHAVSTPPTLTTGGTAPPAQSGASPSAPAKPVVPPASRWVYQLQGYAGGRLDQVAAARADLAVVDLTRDGSTSWFTAQEIAKVRARGKKVLAYFEIGSIEDYRPEYAAVRRAALTAGALADWPGEYWVRYWDERWWALVVKPRLDRALAARFDGVYLDTIVAYEEMPLRYGLSRPQLTNRMAALVSRASAYAKRIRPGFMIVPQNSPELRTQPRYLASIDGIGMEDLFYSADGPCLATWCKENLANALAIRSAGKLVLAIDYPRNATERIRACSAYRRYGLVGYTSTPDLNSVGPSC